MHHRFGQLQLNYQHAEAVERMASQAMSFGDRGLTINIGLGIFAEQMKKINQQMNLQKIGRDIGHVVDKQNALHTQLSKI